MTVIMNKGIHSTQFHRFAKAVPPYISEKCKLWMWVVHIYRVLHTHIEDYNFRDVGSM